MRNPDPISVDQRGVILIIGAFALMGVLVIGGLVIDFGMWFLTREELQNVTDVATLAGGRELGLIYTEKSINDQQNYSLGSGDIGRISSAIDAVANIHQAGGVPITIAPTDIVVGDWNFSTQLFTAQGPGTIRPNAVQVIARRDSTINTPIATVFGQLLSIASFDVIARATAALSPLNRVPPSIPPGGNITPGRMIFPIGIDQDFGDFCNPPPPALPVCNNPAIPFIGCITLNVTTPPANTCTAWTTFNRPNSLDFPAIVAGGISSPMTRTIYDGDPTDPVQPTPISGSPGYYFWGDADAKSALLATDTDFNPANPAQFLESVVPVYQNNCLPPNGAAPLPIVGFVNVRVTSRFGQLNIKFACDVVSTGRSGGQQNFGTWGSIPVLVQ